MKKLSELLENINSVSPDLSIKELVARHEKIVEIQPNCMKSLFFLSNSYMDTKDFIKAEKTTKAILKLSPKHTEFIYNLAIICLYTGRYQESLNYIKTLNKIDVRKRFSEDFIFTLNELIHSKPEKEAALKDSLQEQLKNLSSSNSYIHAEDNKSDVLVVAFTGFGNKLQLPTKDFFKRSGLKHHSKIVIYDDSFQKTLGGIPSYADSFSDFLTYLKKEIAQMNPKKVITVGCSGGGHSALLVAHLLELDEAFSFSPFPYLSYQSARKMGDPLAKSPTAHKINKLPKNVHKYFDLSMTLADWNGKTTFHVHICKDHEWDVKRARTLNNVPHLSIHMHEGESHAVAKIMAGRGTLAQVFSKYHLDSTD